MLSSIIIPVLLFFVIILSPIIVSVTITIVIISIIIISVVVIVAVRSSTLFGHMPSDFAIKAGSLKPLTSLITITIVGLFIRAV